MEEYYYFVNGMRDFLEGIGRDHHLNPTAILNICRVTHEWRADVRRGYALMEKYPNVDWRGLEIDLLRILTLTDKVEENCK